MDCNKENKKPRIKIPSIRSKTLNAINRKWPIHASEICKYLNIPPTGSNISKIYYHLRMLNKENKINVKKINRALIAWPKEIEKLRFIHDFMKED